MLGDLVISLFGIWIVHRTLSLLEKLEVLSTAFLNILFWILQLPLYFYLYFKELFAFVTIYIGIILIFLILEDKIIHFFYKKTFEKLHLQLVDRVILHLHAGKSAQLSLKCVWEDLNGWEKRSFMSLEMIFKINSVPNLQKSMFQKFFYDELALILKSSSQITEQMKSFRAGLATQQSLRHKSRQSVQQIRAQAMVCVVLYAAILLFAHHYLQLELMSVAVTVSFVMFLSGQLFIFAFGGQIKWKT